MLTRRVKAYSSSCSQTVSLSPAISLNLENRDLDCRNLCSMLKISCAACPCISQLISVQFALEMCLAARNRPKNPLKTPILAFMVIQGQ